MRPACARASVLAVPPVNGPGMACAVTLSTADVDPPSAGSVAVIVTVNARPL